MKNLAIKATAIFFLFAAWFLYAVSPILMLGSVLIAWGFWRVPKFSNSSVEDRNKKVGFVIFLVLMAMSMFAYLMVPLFHKMCHALDIGGKVHSFDGSKNIVQGKTSKVEAYPVITMYANVPISVDLAPKVNKLPTTGDFQHVFVLTNKLSNPINSRIKITMAPSSATNYIQEITRFNNQVINFKANEKKHLIVKYHVTKLPSNVHSIAMAYTFFKTRK